MTGVQTCALPIYDALAQLRDEEMKEKVMNRMAEENMKEECLMEEHLAQVAEEEAVAPILCISNTGDTYIDRVDNNEEDCFDDEDDEDSYEEESHGYEWTEQDSWDALTDGMCGKMPSNPLEYDAMMDAMGY